MKTLICPTCGCSLVRLGIKKGKSVIHRHNGEQYHFCCQGCVDVFITDPQKHLQETNDLIVCPKCFESVTLIQPQYKGGAFKGPARAQCLSCMDEQEYDLTVLVNTRDVLRRVEKVEERGNK